MHPEKHIGKISFSNKTNEVLEEWLHVNPSQKQAAYSSWLKKLNSPLTENAVLKSVNKRIDDMIEKNVNVYIKNYKMLSELECDINSTDEDILQQINVTKIVSLFSEIIDEEPIACLSVIVPRILDMINDEDSSGIE